MSKKEEIIEKGQNISNFVKEVAKYFMNFLETDFKKRRIPKRNTIQKSVNGLNVGIDLEKYTKLKTILNKNLNNGFEKESLSIKKGDFTTNIPESLFNLIRDKIESLNKSDLKKIFEEIKEVSSDNAKLYSKEHDKFLEETKEKSKDIISKHLVLPFLDDLDKPLDNLEIADENSKYQLQIEIVDSIFSAFEIKLTELLQSYFSKKKIDVAAELSNIIIIAEIKKALTLFFENYAIGDAYFDIYQLYRNNKLIDKTELYIYFYEISLGNEKFPVLYLPVSIERDEQKFVIQFDKRIFVNTNAIDYIVQEFNLETEQKSTLVGEFERIIYLNSEDDFKLQIKEMINKIEDFFKLNRNIDIENAEFQKGVNLVTSLSNRHYFYLFDKSDEALINDYEDILNDDGELLGDFSGLLNAFIEENPKSFIEEIDDEWDEKDIPARLIVESPIPLNDEQKQVLMALDKDDCKFIILEGPPGTGKSHTITAIICSALLEEKSVLVLSDKKEALDVVEDKIAKTLNKIRHEDDFQNPILRLGRAGNKFYQIVQGQTIHKIKEHYRAYKNKKDEYDGARKATAKELEKNIIDNINYFENIDIKDIEFYFRHTEQYKDINWIEDEKVADIKDVLPRIKNIIEKFKKYKKCDFKTSFINKGNIEKLEKMKEILEEIEENKEKVANIKDYKERIKLLRELDDEKREKTKNAIEQIKTLLKEFDELSETIDNLPYLKIKDSTSLGEIKDAHSGFKRIAELHEDAQKFFASNLGCFKVIDNFIIPKDVHIPEAIEGLREYLEEMKALKNPITGYLFKKEKINGINRKLKKIFNFFGLENSEKHIKEITSIFDLYEFINSKIEKNQDSEDTFRDVVSILVGYNSEEKDIKKNLERFYELSIKTNKEILTLEGFDSLTKKQLGNEIKLIDIIELTNKIQNIYSDNDDKNEIKISLSKEHLENDNLEKEIDYLEDIIEALEEVESINDEIKYLRDFRGKYWSLSQRINLDIEKFNINAIDCILLEYSEKEIADYMKFKEIEQKLENQFTNQHKDTFYDSVTELEELVTAQMTYFLDKRIIEYTQDCATEVNTLKNIIKKKQRFPKDLFRNLKKAFPCILAGIRDYAEYIPLEKDLFDLIVIDEASQVSIAQALPALIRGKKVVVMGDDKQFSNVKANNASKVTNQEFKKKIQDTFKEEKLKGEDRLGWITKVKENFDIKNSILKFMRFIRNYECQLRKHFRCYPEIISYSDKYFYGNSLQCMKVRGKPIEEVIKIELIEHDGKFDETKNTNELEADFIVNKLKEFKEKNIEQTLGIITPHREQVSLLFDRINNMEERDWLFNKCQLKIMTFDTCQGEERDYIFYPLVATKEKDRLNWIFLKDFASKNEEVEGTTKEQRLNVGFSRAKECMHFVISKPIEKFDGEIRNALLHYKHELENGKKQINGGTDDKSPMEKKIQQFFYQTPFYKENKNSIELIPQFPIGQYLKQLDKNYKHPDYKVDFLLIFQDNKIIIEYDGFQEHFEANEEVNISNYEYYMKGEDIYRQKVLEGYGYKFLRINKFNLGEDPIEALNTRTLDLLKKNSKIR